MKLSIERLDGEKDWKRLQATLARIETGATPDPYMNWDFQSRVGRYHANGNPCWAALFHDGDEPIGAAFFVEEILQRYGFRFKALKSLDFAVMHMAPFVSVHGKEEEVAKALVSSRLELNRASGAGLVHLCKLNGRKSIPLIAALEKDRKHFVLHRFNQSYQIDISQGFDAYWKSKKRKSRYNIKRSERLLKEAIGTPLSFKRLRSRRMDDPEFLAAWKKFGKLREQSWQMSEASAMDSDYADRLAAFFNGLSRVWADRGHLDLALLSAGEQVLATQLNVVADGLQWVILMSYERKFESFSPGRLLMRRQLEDACRLGDRMVILGGASESGKDFWSNHVESTLEITWPLCGIGSMVWCFFHGCLSLPLIGNMLGRRNNL